MSISNRIHSFRNAFDFILRQKISFGLPVVEALPADLQFQKEMGVFFSLFDWKTFLTAYPPGSAFTVLDVGARNFSLALTFYQLFHQHGLAPKVHGIEIDAYRRLRNFRTRRDYADFFVSHVSDSQFHVADFLKWQMPADCIFALNPFVTPSPLLAWGLPLKHFRPQDFFKRAAALLEVDRGILFVTNPSEEEAVITRRYLESSFTLLEQHDHFSSVGGHPRYGALYRRT